MRIARQLSVAWLALLLSTSCDQEHLELGALRSDAMQDPTLAMQDASLDAQSNASPSPMLDANSAEAEAGMDGDGGAPLRAHLAALGRNHIRSIDVPCTDECFPVEVIVQGGTPPYRVRWGQNEREGTQLERVCVGEGFVPVVVEDNSAEPNALSLVLSLNKRECAPDTGWWICSAFPLPSETCGGDQQWRGPYDVALGFALTPESSVSLFFNAALSLLDVELIGGNSCKPNIYLGKAPTWGNQLLSFSVPKTAVPITHVRVQTAGQGIFPQGLEAAELQVCERVATVP